MSVPSSAASVSLSARSARCERMAAQPLDELGPADDDPGLRPAEQLVAREADEIGAGGEARAGSRLVADVDQRAGAEVVDERESAALARAGASSRSAGCSVKPTMRKLDWWTRRSTAVSAPIARS